MKSYFAGSVQIAMEEARREMGGEAILVTSRLAPAEAGKARQYEVVFAVESTEARPSKDLRTVEAPFPTSVASRDNAEAADSLQAVLTEIKRIRQDIQTWLPPPGETSLLGAKSAKEFFTHLTNADVDPDLAQQLIASAMKRLSSPRPANPLPAAAARPGRFADVLKLASSKLEAPALDLRTALADSIADVFRIETGFPAPARTSTVVALIGPPGSGKTAALAKLAVRYGLRERKPALLISVDTLRIAASEQLRGYAGVLGMRFELASSTRALEQLLQEQRGYGLILIDTPGFSFSELNESRELADCLASRSEIQKHLVLPAPARCRDMSRMYTAFEAFAPTHLIFSRIDETTVFGPALSQTMGSGLPVSFFTTGPRVPEDIAEASANVITDHILPLPAIERGVAAAA